MLVFFIRGIYHPPPTTYNRRGEAEVGAEKEPPIDWHTGIVAALDVPSGSDSAYLLSPAAARACGRSGNPCQWMIFPLRKVMTWQAVCLTSTLLPLPRPISRIVR